jgi:hypothetical protein
MSHLLVIDGRRAMLRGAAVNPGVAVAAEAPTATIGSAPAVMSRGARKKMLPRNRSLTKNKSGLRRPLPLTLAFTKFDGVTA